ncbi:MAG TPA: ABC transporter ATP-binding protein [Bacillota bacterium]
MIIARRLRKLYGKLEAVAGIDFTVERGECFGLLGPNGAGKTSTIHMIMGRSRPSSGSLTVLGIDVARQPEAVRARIGLVPQNDHLDSELTLRENLEVYARYFGMDGKRAAERTQEVLAFAELTERQAARIDELSGGMRRRAVIARALLNDPELLILDEPTTGLDPQARLRVWDKLRELKERGRTLLLTTHYLDEAWRLCDRVLILDHGRVLAAGDPRQLVAQHVSRWVLEIRETSPDAAQTLLERLDGRSFLLRRHERVGNTLYLYSDDNDALLTALRQQGWTPDRFLARPANLEDLFFILTGRELRS